MGNKQGRYRQSNSGEFGHEKTVKQTRPYWRDLLRINGAIFGT
jgi:hypothetical protein